MRECPDCQQQVITMRITDPAAAERYRQGCPGRTVHYEQAREDAALAHVDSLDWDYDGRLL